MPRKPGHKDYEAKKFKALLEKLLQATGESYRQASEAAGLDSSAVSRYMTGTRPSRGACIALADHFRMNPNDMLLTAGYEPLRFFDRQEVDLSQVRPRTARILEKLERITDPEVRDRLYEVIDVVLDSHLQIQPEHTSQQDKEKKRGVVPEPADVT